MSSATATARARRLSVVVFSHDEAPLLPATLDSATPLADEIVVVEAGDLRATRLQLSRHDVRLVDHVWNHDLSAAYNRGLEQATGHWILRVEPGETIPPAMARSLRAFVDSTTDERKALVVLIETPASRHGGSVERIGQIRVVPRHQGIGFRGRACPSARSSLARCAIGVELSSWTLLAGRHVRDVEYQRRRAHRDLKLIQAALAEDGPDPAVLVARGELEALLQQAGQAEQSFREALRLAPRGSTEMLEAYYGLLAALDNDSDAAERQLALAVEALEIYPLDAQLLCAMGGYLQGAGRHELAARSYRLAYERGQINPETWHLRDVGQLAASCLSLCLQLDQRDDEAAAVLQDALGRWPQAETLLNHLLHLRVKHARMAEALALADRLTPALEAREPLRSAVRGGCLAAGQNWIPARAYLETAYQAGCRHPLCLRWYALTLMALGFSDEAAPVLELWQTLEPQNPEVAAYRAALAPEALAEPPGEVTSGARQPAGIARGGPDPAGEQLARQTAAVPLPHLKRPELLHRAAPPAEVFAMPTASPASAAGRAPLGPAPPVDAPPTPPLSVGGPEVGVRLLRVDSARHPLDANIHFRLGEAYRASGDEQAAEAVWRDYLARCPQSPRVIQGLAELLLRQGRVDEALQVAAGWPFDAAASNPFALVLDGVRRLAVRDLSAACSKLSAARQAGYDDPLVVRYLAQALVEAGRGGEAHALLAATLPAGAMTGPHSIRQSSG